MNFLTILSILFVLFLLYIILLVRYNYNEFVRYKQMRDSRKY